MAAVLKKKKKQTKLKPAKTTLQPQQWNRFSSREYCKGLGEGHRFPVMRGLKLVKFLLPAKEK